MPNRKNGLMKVFSNPEPATWSDILSRPTPDFSEIEDLVKPIFEAVKNEGDKAVYRYTKKFDRVELDEMVVDSKAIKSAGDSLPEELTSAILQAKDNISRFHEAQRTDKVTVETVPGVLCWQEKKAIDKVGLYIPGGTAPLFSTILMLAVPAKIAGCQELVLCTPPGKDGQINPAILFTAGICGIDKVYKVGGVQAIAAMSFGTETIPEVYKIFGPGNQYVTVAKQLATQYGLAIDMPAGPSELMVVADDTAHPGFVASDLLSQAEHGIDSQVILISNSKELIDKVQDEIAAQLKALPRKEIAEKALGNSRAILVSTKDKMIDHINAYSPEHLIICVSDEDRIVAGIRNAGSVFLGNYTPESAGDYASGTNHTLPTNGFAKQYSGVNLDSFMKSITYQKISESGIRGIGKTVATMAEAEGLEAHKKAVEIRLDYLEKLQ